MDRNGVIIQEDKKIMTKWEAYFKTLSCKLKSYAESQQKRKKNVNGVVNKWNLPSHPINNNL